MSTIVGSGISYKMFYVTWMFVVGALKKVGGVFITLVIVKEAVIVWQSVRDPRITRLTTVGPTFTISLTEITPFSESTVNMPEFALLDCTVYV